ncbi:MAG: hypothetical protein ABI895_07855 [Deltaproteobacteria bacterium]
MKSDKSLYLISNRSGATQVVRGSQSHLRLVHSAPLPAALSPAALSPAALSPAAPLPAAPQRPLARRSLSRPWGQRLLQAAGDVAVLAVALIVGLRPSA